MRDKNPYIDITPYQEFIKSTDENLDPSSDTFKIAVVTLYGIVNKNFNYKSLAWHTNTLHRLCAVAVRNLKKNNLWIQKGKKLRHEFIKFLTKSGKNDLKVVIALWLDVCVATGVIIKIKGGYILKEQFEKKSFSHRIKEKFRLTEFQKRQQQLIKEPQ
jgi:hypothetical protein